MEGTYGAVTNDWERNESESYTRSNAKESRNPRHTGLWRGMCFPACSAAKHNNTRRAGAERVMVQCHIRLAKCLISLVRLQLPLVHLAPLVRKDRSGHSAHLVPWLQSHPLGHSVLTVRLGRSRPLDHSVRSDPLRRSHRGDPVAHLVLFPLAAPGRLPVPPNSN
jgi:hypothetical protein